MVVFENPTPKNLGTEGINPVTEVIFKVEHGKLLIEI
jgi:hypothetical protein